jgi:hypothetical protein
LLISFTMKKNFVIAMCFMLLSISSFAQFQKGNLLLGGNLNYRTSATKLDNSNAVGGSKQGSNSFSLGSSLGYFISKHTVTGLKFSYFSSHLDNNFQTGQISTLENNQWLVGPFLRKYFAVKEWVAFYAQVEVNYGSSKQFQDIDASINTTEMKSKSVNISSSLGLSFFPTKWMSIDLSVNPLNFFHQNIQTTVKGTTISGNSPTSELNANGFNLNLNSDSFFLGAHFFINRK